MDQTPIDYLDFSDREIGINLLSRWFPYSVKMCPLCLTASSEPDFLGGTAGVDSIRQLVLNPNSSAKSLFIRLLPIRLQLATDFLHALSLAERQNLIEANKLRIETSMESFIRTAFSGINDAALATLVSHLMIILTMNQDYTPVISRLITTSNVLHHLPVHHPMTSLLQKGGDLHVIVQASIYGALVAGLNTSTLALTTSPDAATRDALARLALLHLDLDRFSIYAHYMARNSSLVKRIEEKTGLQNPHKLADLVEDHMQERYASGQVMRAASGYTFLHLGRNYYKTAYLVMQQLRHTYKNTAEYTETIGRLITNAIYNLELSLIVEKYPQFEAGDGNVHLCRKARLKVPFVFGEFGVRHMLCHLYNELALLGQTGYETELAPDKIGALIREHWWQNHTTFHKLDFGSFQDPVPAQILIPRTIAFASFCFHPETIQFIHATIAQQSGELYNRYVAEAKSLIAAARQARLDLRQKGGEDTHPPAGGSP